MKSFGKRKLIFIESLSFSNFFFIWPEFDTPNVSFYLPTKNHSYRNLHHPIQDRLSLLISKSILAQFRKKKENRKSVFPWLRCYVHYVL